MNALPNLAVLPPFATGSTDVNAIVETPRGSQNKFNYDEATGLFRLGSAMPAGVVFPFEFGFIPSTLGGDGDPLDLLILMDAPTFVGCLVVARLIGVIEAEQTDGDGMQRNDRLIAVAVKSRRHEGVRTLSELPKSFLAEIEHFFVSYNLIKGKTFRPLGRFGAARALKVVRSGIRLAQARNPA